MHDPADVHVHTVMLGDVAETVQRGLLGGIHFLKVAEKDGGSVESFPDFR